MRRPDNDIDRLKGGVSCATVLERLPPVWRLDAAESTRRSLKYRRGPGEILIVNHDGRGWWDPLSAAKGDIFALVRYLDSDLDFRASRRVLRGLLGLAPNPPARLRERVPGLSGVGVTEGWCRRRPLTHGSPTWHYLTGVRGLPERVLHTASAIDVVREGPRGSAWFAHRDVAGRTTGIEMRGPQWRQFSAGGTKTLFQFFAGTAPLARLVVCEAAIDALSLAAIEGPRRDTLYAATAGGMGPGTLTAIRGVLQLIDTHLAPVLVAATDADGAGRRHTGRLAELAVDIGVPFGTLLPPKSLNDWNDALRAIR
jgi:hypothetical protein